MTIHVGQFADGYTPVADGVVTVIRNYAYWINRKYGDCIIFAPHTPGYKPLEPYVHEFFSVPVPGREPYRAGIPNFDATHMQGIRNINFDIVHAHAPFGAGSNASITARRQGIPFVASFHSKYYDDFLQFTKSAMLAKWGSRIVANFYKKADSVWTVNDATAKTLREYGYDGEIFVMPNGTEYTYPQDDSAMIERANEICGTADGTPLFIFVGQIAWKKNVRLIIESLALLQNQYGKDFRFAFIGEGPAQQEATQLAKSLGLENAVSFLGKIGSREDLGAIYCRANALVFPSLYDTAGIVISEAAAMRCPAVLVEGSDAAQAVTSGENGYLCKDNAQSLGAVLCDIVDNRMDSLRIGLCASETLARSWESVVDDVYLKYCEIIEAYQRKHSATAR